MNVELLAPVGSKESFYAAIESHADAVYLGGKQFGARANASNFSNQELKEMIEYAHLFDVKVFVTVNTIVFDDEFDQLIEFLDFLYLNDCDALIVQDLGVVNVVRQRYPDFDLHASTQMNIHSIDQVKKLKELGFKRVVLARELNIDEIINIKKNVDIEIEVFVHGALCVSYSGNCYFSSIIGKRSGNRGRCAQPCRLQYSINDQKGYLISPKDLNTIERVDQLIEAKIDSLKIEGRMKRPEYVAQIVKSYKAAINHYYYKTEFNLDKNQIDLKKIFNRSFTKGFLFNEENSNFVNTEYSNHIGINVGKVTSSQNEYVEIKLTETLKKGDSIRITKEDITDAITLNQIYVNRNIVEEASSGQTIRVKSHKNDLVDGNVFLTTSAEQIKSLEKYYKTQSRKIEITGECFIEDNYLTLLITDAVNYIKVKSNRQIEVAKTTASNDRIKEQIEKTASTVFVFSELNININQSIFISVKEINELRRRALDLLKEKRSQKYFNREIQSFNYTSYFNSSQEFKIKVKVRNEDQLKAVLNFPVKYIYVTDEKLLTYKDDYQNIEFYYCLPRINKNNIKRDVKIVSSDISNLENANTSIYMNIANSYAINLLESLNVKTIGLSLELSFDQIKKLVINYQNLFNTKPNLELMVYGRYELMMLKYCPVNTVIGCAGCNEQEFEIKDRKDFRFPLLREKGCSVKILNSKKLHLIDNIREIYDCGVNNVIIDFTNEDYQEVLDVCDIYFNNKNNQLQNVTFGHFKEGVL